MRINSITTTGVASAVWANVTRTLTADPATDAGAATLVWAHAARGLTTLNPAASTTDANQQSLAAGVAIDLIATAGHMRLITALIGTPNAAGAAAAFDTGDSTTNVATNSIGVNATMAIGNVLSGAVVRFKINNTGTQSDTYSYSYMDVVAV